MKAKITRPIRQREILHEVVPLNQPFFICLDVSSVCNIVCKYCVQYDLKVHPDERFCKQIMPLDLARKAIDDLQGFEGMIKVLTLYGWGEPLLNPHFAEIVEYARKSGKVRSVETISNGILLSHEMSDRLISAGLQRINISVEAMSSEGYYDICGRRIDFQEYVDNIRYLYEHKTDDLTMYIKIGDIALKDKAEEQYFYDTFGDICDEILVEHIINVRDDMLANENIGTDHSCGVFGQELQGNKVCPYLFFRLFICPDGECALCNADFYREQSVGNINTNSLKEIWKGDRLRDIQLKHLRGERNEIDLCSKCGNIKYYPAPADNLDPYASEIIKRL